MDRLQLVRPEDTLGPGPGRRRTRRHHGPFTTAVDGQGVGVVTGLRADATPETAAVVNSLPTAAVQRHSVAEARPYVAAAIGSRSVSAKTEALITTTGLGILVAQGAFWPTRRTRRPAKPAQKAELPIDVEVGAPGPGPGGAAAGVAAERRAVPTAAIRL